MNGLFIGLGILVILTMCWMGYVRKVERRSFSSHLIERLLVGKRCVVYTTG